MVFNSPSLIKLTESDAEKLAAILNMLDPANLLDHAVHDFKTIRNYLASPPFISLAALALLVSLVVESAKSIVPDENSLLEFQTTVIGLLESMSSRYPSESHDVPSKRQKVMLHRSLPTLDLFTSKAGLSEEQLASLANFRDTDIIAVLDPALSNNPLAPIPLPTLADINSVPLPLEPDLTSSTSIIPVENLYYSVFSSFAPTYDSTLATVGYSRSVSMGLSNRRLKKWESAYAIQEEPESAAISNPFASGSDLKLKSKSPATSNILERVVLNQADEDLLKSISLNPIEFTEILNSDDLKVEYALKKNVEYLSLLVRAQWSRLRQSTGSTLPKTVVQGGIEDQTAATLRDTFTKLISTYSMSTSSLLPPPPILAQQAQLIINSLQRETYQKGSLDPVNSKAISETSLMQIPPPPPQDHKMSNLNGLEYLPQYH